MTFVVSKHSYPPYYIYAAVTEDEAHTLKLDETWEKTDAGYMKITPARELYKECKEILENIDFGLAEYGYKDEEREASWDDLMSGFVEYLANTLNSCKSKVYAYIMERSDVIKKNKPIRMRFTTRFQKERENELAKDN